MYFANTFSAMPALAPTSGRARSASWISGPDRGRRQAYAAFAQRHHRGDGNLGLHPFHQEFEQVIRIALAVVEYAEAQPESYILNQVVIKTTIGWRIASIVPVLVPAR